jgi:hypothetical protein
LLFSAKQFLLKSFKILFVLLAEQYGEMIDFFGVVSEERLKQRVVEDILQIRKSMADFDFFLLGLNTALFLLLLTAHQKNWLIAIAL